MSTTQRCACASGWLSPVPDAVCRAWKQRGAPVPRVLGFKPASSVTRIKSRMLV